MKLALIADTAAGRQACRLLGEALQRCGSTVILLGPAVEPAAPDPAWLPLPVAQLAASELLDQVDAVGAFLDSESLPGFLRIHRQMAALRGRQPRPLFSGPYRPLYGDALAADLLPRLGCDLLCLQGEAQLEELNWLVHGTPHAAQAREAIGLWCLPTAPIGHSPSQEPLLVVLDQPDVPASPFANAVLYERLCAVARTSPQWQLRLQSDQPLPADPQHWPETCLGWHHRQNRQPPANLQLGDPLDPLPGLIQARVCLGIGSDWLLPPMVWGKPTVVLGDYGIRTAFNGPLFFGSGVMRRLADCLPLDQLIGGGRPNAAWLDSRGWAIADGTERLQRRLKALVR